MSSATTVSSTTPPADRSRTEIKLEQTYDDFPTRGELSAYMSHRLDAISQDMLHKSKPLHKKYAIYSIAGKPVLEESTLYDPKTSMAFSDMQGFKRTLDDRKQRRKEVYTSFNDNQRLLERALGRADMSGKETNQALNDIGMGLMFPSMVTDKGEAPSKLCREIASTISTNGQRGGKRAAAVLTDLAWFMDTDDRYIGMAEMDPLSASVRDGKMVLDHMKLFRRASRWADTERRTGNSSIGPRDRYMTRKSTTAGGQPNVQVTPIMRSICLAGDTSNPLKVNLLMAMSECQSKMEGTLYSEVEYWPSAPHVNEPQGLTSAAKRSAIGYWPSAGYMNHPERDIESELGYWPSAETLPSPSAGTAQIAAPAPQASTSGERTEDSALTSTLGYFPSAPKLPYHTPRIEPSNPEPSPSVVEILRANPFVPLDREITLNLPAAAVTLSTASTASDTFSASAISESAPEEESMESIFSGLNIPDADYNDLTAVTSPNQRPSEPPKHATFLSSIDETSSASPVTEDGQATSRTGGTSRRWGGKSLGDRARSFRETLRRSTMGRSLMRWGLVRPGSRLAPSNLVYIVLVHAP
ncbi:hypothetical protein IAT38_003764 [Cryptococcus sp. DSM 104549]